MGKKLYVGNLSFSTTEQYLTDTFSQFGTVESARLIIDRDSGRSKGFGFVEMSTEDEAKAAITTLNNSQHEGRAITVNEAKPMAPREGGGGFRGGNRDSEGGGRSRGFGGGGGGGRGNRW